MPKSGQLWEQEFLGRSPHLSVFQQIASPLAKHTSWPTHVDYTRLADDQRVARTPALRQFCFAPAAPKRSRARRDGTHIDIATLYEGRIALQGEIPCLPECYHDLFNAIAWAAFPRAKRAIHARQFRALTQWVPPDATRLPNRRTREQDALTIFDEGGAVWIREHGPSASPFGGSVEQSTGDAGNGNVLAVLFGHAAMEHVAYGQGRIRAAGLELLVERPLPAAPALLEVIDKAVAKRLEDPRQFADVGFDGVVCLEPGGRFWLER